MIIIKDSGSTTARDPDVIYYNGYYYHCFASFESIFVTKSKTIAGIRTEEPACVFTPEADKPYSKQLWAPELHVIDGKCYIYIACDDGVNANHRMYVLYNDSADPQAPYQMGGKIGDSTNKWAIDATVFKRNGKLYTVWSGWEGDVDVCQNLYIAEMSDPFTISSERVLISTPEYEWEKRGATGLINSPFINEGPYPLQKNGRFYIIYSGSGSWCNDYCLGLIELVGDDPMDASAWKKHPVPVFEKTDNVKGPGHATFTTDTPDGDYMYFHAFDEDCSKGWNSCSAFAQKFTWENDFPVFGKPEEKEN